MDTIATSACLLAQLANDRVDPKGFSREDEAPSLESSLRRKHIEVWVKCFSSEQCWCLTKGMIDIWWSAPARPSCRPCWQCRWASSAPTPLCRSRARRRPPSERLSSVYGVGDKYEVCFSADYIYIYTFCFIQATLEHTPWILTNFLLYAIAHTWIIDSLSGFCNLKEKVMWRSQPSLSTFKTHS